jgi:putative transposase
MGSDSFDLAATPLQSTIKSTFQSSLTLLIVLPDHIHGVIELPKNNNDFPLRWRLIKAGFSKVLPKTEHLSSVRKSRGERGIWQRRYCEHLIKDERDYQTHMDYVHINPVKHGLVNRVIDWPHSTFHRLVEAGVYPRDWAGGEEELSGYQN